MTVGFLTPYEDIKDYISLIVTNNFKTSTLKNLKCKYYNLFRDNLTHNDIIDLCTRIIYITLNMTCEQSTDKYGDISINDIIKDNDIIKYEKLVIKTNDHLIFLMCVLKELNLIEIRDSLSFEIDDTNLDRKYRFIPSKNLPLLVNIYICKEELFKKQQKVKIKKEVKKVEKIVKGKSRYAHQVKELDDLIKEIKCIDVNQL